LVLAAGAGTRFGGVKQLAPFRGRPLVEHALAAMGVAPVDRVVVVLGAYADEVQAAVPMHGAESVVVADWREGVSASLRAGIETLTDCEAVVVTLGDQPLLSPGAIARVVQARGAAAAVRATYEGVPGHPVLFHRALFERLRALAGDRGAAAVLRHVTVKEVTCDGVGSPVDVDTRAGLAVLARLTRDPSQELGMHQTTDPPLRRALPGAGHAG
jgi:CTP:molybdopterin cytidylyltransferase MocA